MKSSSFRLSDESLADLNRIAEHLASLNSRAPNQTRALAWAIARGADAVSAAEEHGSTIPKGMLQQIWHASKLLSDLGRQWDGARLYGSRPIEELAKSRKHVAELEKRLMEREAELERAKAKPYVTGGHAEAQEDDVPDSAPAGSNETAHGTRTIRVQTKDATRTMVAAYHVQNHGPLFPAPPRRTE